MSQSTVAWRQYVLSVFLSSDYKNIFNFIRGLIYYGFIYLGPEADQMTPYKGQPSIKRCTMGFG